MCGNAWTCVLWAWHHKEPVLCRHSLCNYVTWNIRRSSSHACGGISYLIVAGLEYWSKLRIYRTRLERSHLYLNVEESLDVLISPRVRLLYGRECVMGSWWRNPLRYRKNITGFCFQRASSIRVPGGNSDVVHMHREISLSGNTLRVVWRKLIHRVLGLFSCSEYHEW
jgi:hypothetical protein